jgi:methyl-accepting chemotaxis protein
MKKTKKTSFAKSFTTVSLFMILIVKLILSLLFFYYLRSVVVDLSEFNTRENVAHSQQLIVSGIKDHEQAIEYAATGIVHFFRQGIFSAEVISGYLNDVIKKTPNSLDIYFTNNRVWNQTGGFAAFGSGWIPDNNWDNTNRPWFIDAKKAKNSIAFSEPYVDADTGDIIVTLSMTVFDGVRDIGVIASDVKVNILGEVINSMKNFSGQEMYIINASGLFITHEDINAVMKKDFFTEKNLELYRASVLGSPDLFKIDKHVFISSSVIPHTGWIIVSTIPSSVIYARTNVFTMRLILFSIVMFVCVTVITIVFTYKKLTVPLDDVLKFSDAIAAKNYDVNISSFRNDEIGDIQQSLVKIRDSLKSNIDSLHIHLSKRDV